MSRLGVKNIPQWKVLRVVELYQKEPELEHDMMGERLGISVDAVDQIISRHQRGKLNPTYKKPAPMKEAILNADPSIPVKELAKQLGTSKSHVYNVRRKAGLCDDVIELPSKKPTRRTQPEDVESWT